MPSAPPPPSKSPGAAPAPRRLLVPLLGLLVLVLAAALTYMLRQQEDGRPGAPVFLPLEALVVNLAPDRASPAGRALRLDADLRMAQVGITLELPDEKSAQRLKAWLPDIRSSVLMLVSQRSASELLDPAGKERLAADVLAHARSVLDPADAGGSAVRRVLLTNLVIQ